MESFSGLLNNAALMLILCIIYDTFGFYAIPQKNLRDCLTGALVGGIGICVMLTPWTLNPGVFFDTRWVLISLCGLFFGFIPTAVAVIISGAFRLYLGGPGAIVGTIVIAVTAGVGLAWRYWKNKHDKPLGWKQLYVFGILVQLAMLSCMFLMPADMRIPIIKSVAPPILLLYPLLTVVIGIILKRQEDRRTADKDLIKEITERKLAEEKERASKAYLDQILNNIGDPVFVKDDQHRMILVNDAFCSILDLPRVEIIGKTLAENLPPDEMEHFLQTDRQVLTYGQENLCEESLTVKGKKTLTIVTKKTRWVNDNGNMFIIGVIRDNTERKQADDRYKKTVEISIDGFWAVDLNGKLLDVNHAYCLMIGFSKNELLRMSISDVEANQSDEEIKENIHNIIKDGSALFESQHRHKNGELIDVEVSTTYSADDGIFFTFIREITQRKAAEKVEERLQQAQKMEAIGTLAGGIAHDFNNILGVILGYAELAKEKAPLGSQIKNDLEKILISANRAKDLVRQILAFSHKTQVERSPLKLQLLIKEGLTMLRSSIPTTISITEDSDPRCGTVLADPTQVHQILINLCTNAYHAMEKIGGELSVTLKATVITPDNQKMLLHLAPGEYVELTVTDTGAGIGPDDMVKIFDPYYTTKETGKGTGLGLSIIHGIMNECGGAVTVESQLGRGSTFHVYFPAVKEDALPETKEQEDIPRGKERVLFIDDEAILAQMGKDMLERLGYHVTVRHTSFEALETFQNIPDKFDLVITDQTMPGITGADLARRMLQIRPDIPIILCTGYSNLIDEFSAKAIGIKEFAFKPLAKKDIAKLVRKVLDVA
ncbi:MAG: PAS domain S-box-containing protein [Desulforhopalus sp.]|jgi:PAS domain S-box-containing protein